MEKIFTFAGQMGKQLYELAIMKDGEIAYQRYVPGNRCQDSYSVTKAFVMTAAGLLWDRGKLDVREPILSLLPQYADKAIDPKWKDVTVDDALRHRIGFADGFLDIDVEDASQYEADDYLDIVFSHPLAYAPGEHSQYSDAAFYLLSRAIGERAGTTCDRLLEDMLFSALRFQEIAWSRCPMGHPIGATGLYIAARDMVKLGYLYLCGGLYQGRRILSEAWVRLALERGYELHPAGNDLYGKGGMNGQMLLFAPERGFAVAWHAYEPEGLPELLNRFEA